MGRPLLLGLDVGTSRCKALLVDREGVEIRAAAVPTPFVRRGEAIEMGTGALRSALERVLSELGAARTSVAAVGLAGMAESGAPLDDRGDPLAPVIAWHDPRGGETVATLQRSFGERLPRRIGQRVRTVSSVAKLGWLIDSGVTGVRRWLGVPELCLFALTGSQATDPSLAARTGAYDIVEGRWLDEVAATVGVATEVFPAVHAAGTPLGRLSAAASVWSGLPAGVPVTLAGHDHLAALTGSGASPGDFGNSVGTAEAVVATTATLPDLERALTLRVAVTLAPSGRGWVLLAGAARAGTAVAAVAGALGASPVELDRMAEGAGTVAGDRLLAGALAGDVDLPAGAGRGAIWNGLLAALSQRTWEAVRRAGELVGPPLRLVVFGGGATSGSWLAAKAALGPTEVWRTTTREAAARGAALAAGTAAGWWPTPQAGPAAALEAVASQEGQRS